MRGREPSATRRGFLALAGSATLAGCNGVRSDLFGEETTTLDGSELREMANRPVPTVPPVAPVEIERSYLDAKAKRARDLLASVPDPLGPAEIPNGAIRREVADERESAERSLEAAANASSPLDAMDDLRSARERARYVAAAWRAIDGDLSRREATAGRGAIRDGVDAFREKWRYVGADPIRAVLVHRIIESRIGSATGYAGRDDGRHEDQPESAPAVGEAASRLERARASLDDATYVRERFLASVDEPRDLRPTFERVAASLIEAQRERRDSLPEGAGEDPSQLVDRDVGDTPAAELLEALYHDVTRWRANREEWEDDGLASVILGAHRRDARFRAFDSVRERVSNGEDFAVDEASDVVGFRENAVSAVESALDSDRYPRLVRNELAEEAREIGYADGRFRDSDDEVRASYIGYHAVRYVEIAATARAIPAASERVGGGLRSA